VAGHQTKPYTKTQIRAGFELFFGARRLPWAGPDRTESISGKAFH